MIITQKSMNGKAHQWLNTDWRFAALCCTWVVAFILLLKPFNTHHSGSIHLIKSLGVICGTFTFLYLIISKFGNPRSVFQTVFILIATAVTSKFLHWQFTLSGMSLGAFSYWVYGTLITFSAPFILRHIYLRRLENLDGSVDKHFDPRSSVFIADNDLQLDPLLIRDFLFAHSAKNYIELTILKDGELKKILVRSTMKGFNDVLSTKWIQRCHKSYFINILKIDHIKGNKRGYTAKIKANKDLNIPISATYFTSVQEKLHSRTAQNVQLGHRKDLL